MSNVHDGNPHKPEVPQTKKEVKKEAKPKKELTPQQIQKRKKMLVYPLFFLVFIGVMWLIFAPSGDKENKQSQGFNPELPIPKEDAIVGDKRTAYQQEAMLSKQNEKMRSLQDFAVLLGKEEDRKAQESYPGQVNLTPDDPGAITSSPSRNGTTLQSSANAYKEVNQQLNSWYNPPAQTDKQAATAVEQRIGELERKLEESQTVKSEQDKQLELIEKSYQIAAKYAPNTQGQSVQTPQNATHLKEKVIPKSVSQVHHSVVSRLSVPMDNEEFLEEYGQPRNLGFITATVKETKVDKNSIRACVNQTVTISNGKELQLRLLEPMKAGTILIPANTVMTGSAKMGGERLHITITSIQYANHILPVELEVYDVDGMQGVFVPNSDELNALKEIAANSGTSMGSSINITDNAGSQLASDLGRSAIQGVSQFFSKKMREVKVTLKAGYKVLLLPKT